MRKCLLIVISLFSCVLYAKAQSFELTAKGFVNSSQQEVNYIIIPFEGKSQTEIFNMALAAIGKNFVSPQNVINKVEYSQININGLLENVTQRKPMGMVLPFDMKFNLILEFKDGKMKLNAPIIRDIEQQGFADVHIYLTTAERGSTFLVHNFALFKNNGKVNEKKHKENIQEATNNLIASILNDMNAVENADW